MALPQRMCVVCRTMKSKDELLRITRFENEFFVDTSGKMPGRGAYICKAGVCKEKFDKQRSFERAFHGAIGAQLKEKIIKELI